VHTNREKYMSYNNLKRICGNLKAIKQLKLPSLRLCVVTKKQDKVMGRKQDKVMGRNLSSVPPLAADMAWQALS
jgi:hypothetical protein